MDFALTEEQELLRHSVQRLFVDHYAFEARKREQRQFAREGLPAFRAQQRAGRLGAAE